MPVYVDPSVNATITVEPQEALRWLEMPYGSWTCDDGREVLFNRIWCPIWERGASDTVWRRADRREWVDRKTKQTFFYSDGQDAESDKQTKAQAALAMRGLTLPALSELVTF